MQSFLADDIVLNVVCVLAVLVQSSA